MGDRRIGARLLQHAGQAPGKKLRDVVCTLLGEAGGEEEPPGVEETALADLKAFGMSPAEIAKFTGRKHAEKPRQRVIDVEPENANAVRLFLRLQSQWQMQPLSDGKRALLVRTGLDYTALPVVAGALGLALDAELLDQVRILEDEALSIYARRQQRVFRGF